MLALKLLLVPALIGLITLAAHRWGPAVAGWLSGFPVVSGPVLLFLAVERGPEFTAQAAIGTLSAVVAILLFGVSYAWAATRWSWFPCLLTALAVYFVGILALDALAPSMAVAALLTSLSMLLAPYAFPRLDAISGLAAPQGFDVLLRMMVGAVLVLLVTHFASDLGPRLSGLLAMFPVMAGVLAVFSQRQSGAAFTVRLLRGMVFGYYAFAGFCLVLALTLPRMGITTSFCLALACALFIQAGSRSFLNPAKSAPLEAIAPGKIE
ncbi:hypothetical protein [Nevskia soli]|uniref:hypothetical protein n=1 Tax=Nevskia soli TaxID=418856 RepID=UPI0004A75135|nr:hypothetical protein [Nevskia soli]